MTLGRILMIFAAGGVCGVYAAQTYDVPRIDVLAAAYYDKMKRVEAKYRKKENGG